MAFIEFEKFNFNQFYEKTPLTLKYIIVISLLVVGSYFLYATKIDNSEERQIDKIEESIQSTYVIINQFEKFKDAQLDYNKRILNYLDDIYVIVEELNENTNKKFDILLKQGGSNTEEIIERLMLLNESFEKLHKAYVPDELKEKRDYSISAEPIEK